MRIERRRITYQGRVQGVGFRMTARRLASAYPIAGHVRNQEDGGVELIVEGVPDDVSSYLTALQREFGTMINNIHEEIEPSSDEPCAGFTIRY